MSLVNPAQRRHAQDLLDFIDASPSPWHAADSLSQRLFAQGFALLDERERWTLEPGGRYCVVRDGSSLIALLAGTASPGEDGFRLLGAHSDSPGLRLRPNAPHAAEPMARLGVEIYGGPILASFADRDLSLAGRLALCEGGKVITRLLRFERPLLRLPNLAIHMNRAVNEEGLKFHKQFELPLLWAGLNAALPPPARFRALLAGRVSCAPEDILGWELHVCDTQPGAFWGAEEEFLADSQIDNLASCHAGLSALLAGIDQNLPATRVLAFFDHEEVGSESAEGAGGGFLADVLRRASAALGCDDEDHRRALAKSFLVSADMAHAYHPNFPNAYDPQHMVRVNGGPVVKIHAGQRYATDSLSAARFSLCCEEAGVPCQCYSHRGDLACGSTIGPMSAAKLGVAAVDVGNPMWAMHSVRESAGVLDHDFMTRALTRFFLS
jgi:aspartyl aminopeptidase